MSIFAFHPKPAQLFINQPITLILTALSGCSLVQKNTSVCVLGILYKVHIGSNHADSGKSPLCSGCFASGIPQGRHLQMPGRSWRAGQPSGDGKPVGPDVPP